MAVVVLVPVFLTRGPDSETSLRTPASEGRADDTVGLGPSSGDDTPSASPGATVPSGAKPSVSPTSTLPSVSPRVPSAEPDNAPPAVGTQPFRLAASRSGEVWELGDDGAPLRRLATDAADPAWSPDGRLLAYAYQPYRLADRPPSSVYVLDLATMQARAVAEDPVADLSQPAFSPDGSRLAVTRWGRTTSGSPSLEPTVVVFDLDAPSGQDGRWAATGEKPSWSPDGRILYACGSSLCISASDGSDRTVVPNSTELSSPAWSPDGTWITGTRQSDNKIEVMRPDGTGRRTLGGNTGAGTPTWTPDSSRILYSTSYGLRSIRPDGSDLRAHTAESWVSPAAGPR